MFKGPLPTLTWRDPLFFVLKSRFCKWRALIGLHLCQAFLQKDEISSCGRVGVVFLLYHSSTAKSVNEYNVFLEVDETSVVISGFRERTMYSSLRCNRPTYRSKEGLKCLRAGYIYSLVIRDFTMTRRQRKRRFKNEFALFWSLLRLFQLTYFVKCRRTLPELNF